MEDNLDANVIKSTQLTLGKYVKRPPLSDKLLRKPPFRFLHDIVTSVLKSKGFFEGLFDENELVSENVKDRESKISFLNKVISVVSLTTGKSLLVKPSKIVAGQEPAKTNELLQCLAEALDKNLSSDEAVKQFKSGIKVTTNNVKKQKVSPKTNQQINEEKKLTSKSNEKVQTSEKNEESIDKSKNKEIPANKKESPPKKSSSKMTNKKLIQKSNQEGKKNYASNRISVKQKEVDAPPKITEEKQIYLEESVVVSKESTSNEIVLQDIKIKEESSNATTSGPSEQEVLEVTESISKTTSANDKLTNKSILGPPSADKLINENILMANSDDKLISKGIPKQASEQFIEFDGHHEVNAIDYSNKDETNDDGEKVINQSSTNLDGIRESNKTESENSSVTVNHFDKKDSNTINIMRPVSVRPSSSRPGAPRIRDKSDNMINDAENVLVGKVNIISENALLEEEENTNISIENAPDEIYETLQNQDHNNIIVNQNSHLVQQILDSQREFTQKSGKTEIEWQFVAQKAPDIFIQEMEQLKFNVQAMSRIANPLGKLLDHIQEDVEIMRQELQQWKKVYEETSKDLLKQKTVNEESLLPIRTKLTQLTKDIEERHEKITDLKVSIRKNSTRIEKLLTNGNVQ